MALHQQRDGKEGGEWWRQVEEMMNVLPYLKERSAKKVILCCFSAAVIIDVLTCFDSYISKNILMAWFQLKSTYMDFSTCGAGFLLLVWKYYNKLHQNASVPLWKKAFPDILIENWILVWIGRCISCGLTVSSTVMREGGFCPTARLPIINW